eukprot:TRINITY_DN8001_c0_g1_i1.p1 TRINITY_DN8001_c0_g1~~TRINITY_DN8001_c0_g1_i1.p1  ORF type:complete len:307 (-),score=94.36 TRINITY_DN8001_c0_g1_i1:37-957(-)
MKNIIPKSIFKNFKKGNQKFFKSYIQNSSSLIFTRNYSLDLKVASDLLNKNKFTFVTERIQSEERFRISKQEFAEICNEADINPNEQETFLSSLHNCGIVLNIKQAPNFVYLKPKEVTREFLRVMDPDGQVAHAMVLAKSQDLELKEQEYQKLKEIKAQLDLKAHSSSRKKVFWTTLGFAIQGVVMARLIWWDLSWDIMEPVAYIMGFSYATLAWGVWSWTRLDINDYKGVYLNSVSNKQLAFYRRNNFDFEKFKKLEEEIAETKSSLASFGVYSLGVQHKYILSQDDPLPLNSNAVDSKQTMVLN